MTASSVLDLRWNNK